MKEVKMKNYRFEKTFIVRPQDIEITPEEFFATRPGGKKSLVEAQEKIRKILRNQKSTETFIVFKWRELPIRQSLANLIDVAQEMFPGINPSEITICVENGGLYIEGMKKTRS